MALAEILQSIDEQKKLADSLRPIATERLKILNQKLRLDWNYNSNALEGNTLTLSETRMLLLHGYHIGNKLGRHYDEIELHNDVLLTLEELVRGNEPMTEILIRSLHHQLMGDEYFVSAYDSLGNQVNVKGKPGEYKDKSNGVKRVVNGKEVFVPFKTPDEVRMEMPELIDWYRAEEEKAEMHPVMLAAIFHFRFVTLHPFDDGNGRMGRILMNMILMRSGYTPAIIRIDERPQYNANLALAQDGGTIEPFIELVANDTLRSLELLVKAAKGESIEEADDLDKEIELLKRNAKQENTVQININNAEYRPQWQKGLNDLLFKIDSKLQKFMELFNKSNIEYHYLAKAIEVNSVNEISDFLISLTNPGVIKIDYQFYTYKNAGTNYFDTGTSIDICLYEYKYLIIHLDENQKQIRNEYLYNKVIDTKTIDKIVSDMAKMLLNDIKQNT
jgi:Fic family protein